MPVLNTTQLYHQVYEHLREEITRGVYRPGQRLLVEQLASELGVSQTPVRAALTRLQSDGLIEIFPRKGTFVVATTPKEVREVFQLRRIIECASLESGVAPAAELLQAFERVVAESSALIDGEKFVDYVRYLQLDVEFHHLIVSLLQNQRASSLYQTLRWPVQLMLALVGSDDQRSSNTVGEHQEIVSRLKTGDLQGAKEALVRHLVNSELDLVSRLSAMTGTTEAPSP
jgi:DNA-binding GntR family transcriptional regulator